MKACPLRQSANVKCKSEARAERDSEYSLSRKVSPEGARAHRQKKATFVAFYLFPQLITTSVAFFAYAWLSAREPVRGRHIEG